MMKRKLFVFALFFLVYNEIRKSNRNDRVTGIIGMMLVVLPVTFVALRAFFIYILDLRNTLAACCSIGPVTAKNPFSGAVVAYTLLSIPSVIAISVYTISRGEVIARQFSGKFFKSSKLLALLPCILFSATVPLAMQGAAIWTLLILAFYVLTCVVYSIIFRDVA